MASLWYSLQLKGTSRQLFESQLSVSEDSRSVSSSSGKGGQAADIPNHEERDPASDLLTNLLSAFSSCKALREPVCPVRCGIHQARLYPIFLIIVLTVSLNVSTFGTPSETMGPVGGGGRYGPL